MFVCGSLCSGSAVLVGSLMQVGTALRVGNDHVPVDQGIRRRAFEAVVQPRLLHLELPLVVGPSAGPCRLEYLGPRGEAGLPPDPSEGVPQRVMTADNEAADLAHQCVETIGVERLHALAPGGRGFGSSSEAASALVPTPLPGRLEVEGDTEPEAGTDLILRVSEPSGGPRRCGQNPSAGPSAAASPEASARSRRQSLQETSSRRFCPAPAE